MLANGGELGGNAYIQEREKKIAFEILCVGVWGIGGKARTVLSHARERKENSFLRFLVWMYGLLGEMQEPGYRIQEREKDNGFWDFLF